MPQKHRFRLPDGQTFESDRGPAAIRRAYPDAVITHRVEDDGFGQAILVPYEGKASAEPAATEEEPAKGEPKPEPKASKKGA